MLLNPNVNMGEFDNKTFNIIKERVKDSINHIYEDPQRLSLINALKLIGEFPSAHSNIVSLIDQEDITPNNLYTYYEKIIKNDYIDIFILGNLDMEEITKIIIEYVKFNIIKNHPFILHVHNNLSKENLVYILKLDNLSSYEEKYVANLYNHILSQNSLQNKNYSKN